MDIFFIEHDDLLDKNLMLFGIKSVLISKEFDSKPIYNKEFLKTKIKSNGDEVIDF